MVKIALAGASGNVANEVFDRLHATGRHEIVLLSRKRVVLDENINGASSFQTDYQDVNQLAHHLHGVHTVLCFITSQTDPGNASQKTLIEAAIKAGVHRYAPSEWATSGIEQMSWSANKGEIRLHLKDLNKEKTVLEYCLFQPGMFVDYFAWPYQTSKHLHPFQNQIDFKNRKAIVVDGADDSFINLITMEDFCSFVVRAVEYGGTWPIIGGIKGDQITVKQLILLGEKIRGSRFAIDRVDAEDLKAGVVKTSWLPKIDHPAMTKEEIDTMSSAILSGVLLSISAGEFSVSDEWNSIFPDLRVTSAETFLAEVWKDKS